MNDLPHVNGTPSNEVRRAIADLYADAYHLAEVVILAAVRDARESYRDAVADQTPAAYSADRDLARLNRRHTADE